jgi:transposase
VAKMLNGILSNILTWLTHRITNATRESLNAKIQWVKCTARGFRNRVNFKTAIYFHCGGLDMGISSIHTPKPERSDLTIRTLLRLRYLFQAELRSFTYISDVFSPSFIG